MSSDLPSSRGWMDVWLGFYGILCMPIAAVSCVK